MKNSRQQQKLLCMNCVAKFHGRVKENQIYNIINKEYISVWYVCTIPIKHSIN